jgi:hypothetical protein
MLWFTKVPFLREVVNVDIFPLYQMGKQEQEESFCVNYFVSESHPVIVRYTQTEKTIIMLTLEVFWYRFPYVHRKGQFLSHSALFSLTQICLLLWILARGEGIGESRVKVDYSYAVEVRGLGTVVIQPRSVE